MKSIILMCFLFGLLLVNMSQYEAKAVSKSEVATAVDLKNILDNQLQSISEMRDQYRRVPKKTVKFNMTPRASELLARKLEAKAKRASQMKALKF